LRQLFLQRQQSLLRLSERGFLRRNVRACYLAYLILMAKDVQGVAFCTDDKLCRSYMLPQ
jgi:hypothetical protein